MTQLITARGSIWIDKVGEAHAEFDRQSGCSRCAQASACGTGVLQKAAARHRSPLPGSLAGKVNGNVVEVAISASAFLWMIVLCYLLPATLCVIGAWFASRLLPWNPDLAVLCGGIAGIVAAGAVLRADGTDRLAQANVSFSCSSGYNPRSGY